MRRTASSSSPARLFPEHAPPPLDSARAHIAQIDGAARGNPGPASYGVVIRAPDGRVIAELKKYIGRATNNVAEYYALIAALDYAAAHGIRALRVRGDSELLVRQMQGRYKVKSQDLRPLFERARKMSQALQLFSVEYVPREQNREADALANQALDSTATSPSVSSSPRITTSQSDNTAANAGANPGRLAGSPPSKSAIRPATGSRIRARYSRGVLVPSEKLDLPDNSEVEITIHLSTSS